MLLTIDEFTLNTAIIECGFMLLNIIRINLSLKLS